MNSIVNYINGPINVVRMEGQVNGISKILYLFLDSHEDKQSQTNCNRTPNMDVADYLSNAFSQLNGGQIVYDFFLEVFPSEIAEGSALGEKRYIDNTAEFFIKTFRYDSTNNRVKMNPLFAKVRFHYFDLRDYFFFYPSTLLLGAIHRVEQFVIAEEIVPKSLNQIIEQIKGVHYYLGYVIYLLTKQWKKAPVTPQVIKKDRQQVDTLVTQYFAYKIKHQYEQWTVHQKLNDLLDESVRFFENLKEQLSDSCDRFQSYHTTLKYANIKKRKRMITEMKANLHQVYGNLLIAFIQLADIYFLRRFLDKSYVTHSIVYSGYSHSIFYISYLVKKFHFKVTHASSTEIADPVKLTRLINKIPLDEIADLLAPTEPIIQCSNMAGFPLHFQ